MYWQAAKLPTFNPGDRVRKRMMGKGFTQGTVVSEDGGQYVVAWDGTGDHAREWPAHLLKDDDYPFEPEMWRKSADERVQSPSSIPRMTRPPEYDHREKAKYKPGDWLWTSLGPVVVINSGVNPMGPIYRVQPANGGDYFDIDDRHVIKKIKPGTLSNTIRQQDNKWKGLAGGDVGMTRWTEA